MIGGEFRERFCGILLIYLFFIRPWLTDFYRFCFVFFHHQMLLVFV